MLTQWSKNRVNDTPFKCVYNCSATVAAYATVLSQVIFQFVGLKHVLEQQFSVLILY